MKKIKDFIYDYNDVLIALLIVCAAGLIIFWRVNAVLDYSNYLTSKEDVKQIDIDFSGVDLTQEEVDNQVDPEPEKVEEPVVCEHTYEAGVCTKCGEKDPDYVEPEPVPQVKTYTLEVSKAKGTTNWTACGKELESKGIITSSTEFVSRVVVRKVESSLQPGKYDLNSGMTTDEIIDILIKK